MTVPPMISSRRIPCPMESPKRPYPAEAYAHPRRAAIRGRYAGKSGGTVTVAPERSMPRPLRRRPGVDDGLDGACRRDPVGRVAGHPVDQPQRVLQLPGRRFVENRLVVRDAIAPAPHALDQIVEFIPSPRRRRSIGKIMPHAATPQQPFETLRREMFPEAEVQGGTYVMRRHRGAMLIEFGCQARSQLVAEHRAEQADEDAILEPALAEPKQQRLVDRVPRRDLGDLERKIESFAEREVPHVAFEQFFVARRDTWRISRKALASQHALHRVELIGPRRVR